MPANKNIKNDNLSVYVIAGQRRDAVNDRVEKVSGLRGQFAKLTLITLGKNQGIAGEIQIRPYFNPTGILRVSKLNKLKNLIDKYLFFPSTTRLYAWAVEHRLKKLISSDLNNGLSICLIICVPPHDLCLAGISLKRKFPQIRWLMDWQDLWSYDENYFNRVPKLYRRKLLRLERKTFSECDLNITTNKFARDVLINKYGVSGNKISSIPHHYTTEENTCYIDKPEIDHDRNDTLKIGFLGTLFKPPRVPGMEIVQVIQNLRKDGFDVELHIHGLVSRETEAALSSMDLSGIILHGKTSHENSLKLIRQYDFLLLLLADLPNSRAVMSIKLPHYFLTGLPILAVVPEKSAIADIIRKTGTGYVIDSSGHLTSDIKTVLTKHNDAIDRPQRSQQEIEAYSWEKISRLWEKAILEEYSR